MKMGLRILAVLLPLTAGACTKSGGMGPQAPGGPGGSSPPGEPSEERTLELESLYMNTSIRLTNDARPARFVSLRLTQISRSELMGTLVLDPNTCSLDVFGDRQACTRIAVQAIDVELQLVRELDPAGAGRRYFQVTGEGIPRDLALIVRGSFEEGELERSYLKLGSELVPLYLEGRG